MNTCKKNMTYTCIDKEYNEKLCKSYYFQEGNSMKVKNGAISSDAMQERDTNNSGPSNYKAVVEEECSLLTAFFNFLSFGVLLFVGYIKEFFCPPCVEEKNRKV